MSQYLFILVIETLQHVFKKAMKDRLLLPLRDRMDWLRLSLYAVDAAMFINLIKADVDLTMSILQHFGDTTGLRINLQKSTVAPIRCSQLNLVEVLQNFSGKQVHFPVTYLGLPICFGRLRMVHF
jgi:hypothetical protein